MSTTNALLKTDPGSFALDRANLFLKLAAGPLVFFAFLLVAPAAMTHSAAIVMGTFLWMVTWWATLPFPMAITTFLPLLVFPALGVMNISDTAGLYGQTLFFWIMGFALLGHAMNKHGLAKRFGLWILSIKGVANTTHRLIFVHMLACGLVACVVSDAAVVGMMIPVGISALAFVRTLTGSSGTETRRLGTCLALGTMYGAIAGGCTTLAGIPVKAISHQLVLRLTGDDIGWFRWMMVGVPVFLVALVLSYFLLVLFFPPEFSKIPAGQDMLREESKKMGPLSIGERNVLIALVLMVGLFLLPSLTTPLLGAKHPFTVWAQGALSLYAVPVIVMFLLFGLPTNLRNGEFTLDWKKDGIPHGAWEAALITAAAIGMTVALDKFGFTQYLAKLFGELPISRFTLPFVAGYATAIMTEFNSGNASVALMGNIFIPAAKEVGFNPASMGMLMADVAIGKIFPWAGPAAAVCYASGEVSMKDMIKVGLVATFIVTAAIVLVNILFAPIF